MITAQSSTADVLHKLYQVNNPPIWNPAIRSLHSRVPTDADVVMTSNDYLGIAQHSSIIAAETLALEKHGHGLAASRPFQEAREHRDFEQRMASLLGTEDAYLAQSGYAANVGLVETLATVESTMYVDSLTHASFWKGCQSAGIRPHPFIHNSASSLKRQLAKFGPGIVLVDAVYSTNGSLCKLREIVDVATTHECILVVDETHSFGVQGTDGCGLTRELGLQDRVHFQVVGLSKAFACRGGIIAGPVAAIENLPRTSFPAIFSTQVMPHEVAGFQAALDIILDSADARARLHQYHAYLKSGLKRMGYQVDSCDTQIVTLEPGQPDTTRQFRDYVEDRGIFGSPYSPPATSNNRFLIRYSLNATLTQGELDRALNVLNDAYRDLRADEWPSNRCPG